MTLYTPSLSRQGLAVAKARRTRLVDLITLNSTQNNNSCWPNFHNTLKLRTAFGYRNGYVAIG